LFEKQRKLEKQGWRDDGGDLFNNFSKFHIPYEGPDLLILQFNKLAPRQQTF
jgi:hypothetical protein